LPVHLLKDAKTVMNSHDPQELFNSFYYNTSCGVPYQRDEHWTTFFGHIAREIVNRVSPKTALDTGCAFGLLVEQLRLLGVDATGVDISEHAIANAPDSVRPYVRVASVTEPFGQRYDLIVCIEVLEHMAQSDAERAIANLTAHTDDIPFSSTPYDYKEATHFNVHPIEYWVELFARHGFIRDVDFDASFITPWAMRLRRRSEPLPRIIRDYERRYWEVWKAVTDLRELVLNQRNQIERLQTILTEDRNTLQATLDRVTADRDALQAALAHVTADRSHMEAYVARLEADLAQKNCAYYRTKVAYCPPGGRKDYEAIAQVATLLRLKVIHDAKISDLQTSASLIYGDCRYVETFCRSR